jgi:hypothetical protein
MANKVSLRDLILQENASEFQQRMAGCVFWYTRGIPGTPYVSINAVGREGVSK